jgi:hypothetical protein
MGITDSCRYWTVFTCMIAFLEGDLRVGPTVTAAVVATAPADVTAGNRWR